MKEADSTIHQKIITSLLLVVIICRYTSDNNHKLTSDTIDASMLDMDLFPDQS